MITVGSRRPQSVRAHAPNWWQPNDLEDSAMTEWDTRHLELLGRASRTTRALRRGPNRNMDDASIDAIAELARNRFYIRDKADLGVVTYEKKLAKPKARKPKPWKLLNSIWGPRRKYSDAKDFYDPPEVKARAFDVDWEGAREKHGFDKKLVKAAKSIEDAEAQAGATPAALKAAIFEHCDLVYQVFNYYCSFGASDDIYNMSVNSYLQVLREAKLVNNAIVGQRDADLQLMFDESNAAGRGSSYDNKNALDREEWLGVLVRLLLRRHIEGGGKSIANAVHCFCVDDLARNVPSICMQDTNAFRAQSCYIEETDIVLKKYEPSLRALFSAFAYGTGAIGDKLADIKLLDYGEYMEMVGRLDLMDAFVTQREVRLLFIWSRMIVVDEKTLKGRSHILQLHFEDFLELIVRLAHIKALPSEEELNKSGLAHAGEFLAALSDNKEDEQAFCSQRTREPGEVCDLPIAWKVRQVILWMVFRARGELGDPELELSKREAEKFKKGGVQRARRGEDSGPPAATSPGAEEDEFEIKIDAKSRAGDAPDAVMAEEAILANTEASEQLATGDAQPATSAEAPA